MEKKPGIKVKVEVEVEVPQEWIDYGIQYSDLFRHSECGYWMRGVKLFKTGWLVWDFESDERPLPDGVTFIDRMSDEDEKKHHGKALRAYAANKPLPKYYYRLDKNAMVKAFIEGCKLWGTGWYEDSNTDSNSYDQVMQLAFFNEVIYG